MRMGVAGPAGSGDPKRMTIDGRGIWGDHGDAPASMQTTLESITPVIARGSQDSAAPTNVNDQTVSPISGRSRTEDRAGGSVWVGARTSEPRPESQITAVAIVARNSSEVSRAPPGGIS